ncbi:MAG TPA: hypothetical protein VGN86_16375 [Pyrinomonadaceae bacterium]|nr:hypothetical protein [Pyrinomonadaceae bacterium]
MSNAPKRQGVASVTAEEAKASADKDKGKRKNKPKPEKLSNSVSAGQRK